MKESKERAAVIRLLKLFRIAYLDGAIAAKGGEIVRDYGTALPDALIAATAISKGLWLATRNTRHFQGIADLIIQPPY